MGSVDVSTWCEGVCALGQGHEGSALSVSVSAGPNLRSSRPVRGRVLLAWPWDAAQLEELCRQAREERPGVRLWVTPYVKGSSSSLVTPLEVPLEGSPVVDELAMGAGGQPSTAEGAAFVRALAVVEVLALGYRQAHDRLADVVTAQSEALATMAQRAADAEARAATVDAARDEGGRRRVSLPEVLELLGRLGGATAPAGPVGAGASGAAMPGGLSREVVVSLVRNATPQQRDELMGWVVEAVEGQPEGPPSAS